MKKVEILAKEIRDFINYSDKHIMAGNDWKRIYIINKILDAHAPIEKTFPKHMIRIDDGIYPENNGVIVFFKEEGKGIAVKGSGRIKKGVESSNWHMGFFKDCEIQVKP